jgi:acetyl-CoA carboxylase carboxyl transferase subunit alpha
VISPEACASIIWRSGENTQDAAEALKLTAQDLLKLGIIDTIVPEPLGGAHRGREPAMAAMGEAIETVLRPLVGMDAAALRTQRREKFLAMGNRGL